MSVTGEIYKLNAVRRPFMLVAPDGGIIGKYATLAHALRAAKGEGLRRVNLTYAHTYYARNAQTGGRWAKRKNRAAAKRAAVSEALYAMGRGVRERGRR